MMTLAKRKNLSDALQIANSKTNWQKQFFSAVRKVASKLLKQNREIENTSLAVSDSYIKGKLQK